MLKNLETINVDNVSEKYVPLISICIPVFNGEKYIRETIESIIMQNYPSIEILIQDNSSTDNTWSILQSMTQKYPQINIQQNLTNIGMTNNWNLVTSRACGDYIMLIGADDFLERNFLFECINIFKNNNVDVVTTDHFVLYQFNGKKKKRSLRAPIMKFPIIIKEGIYQNFAGLVLKCNPFSINFTIFSKETFQQLSNNDKFFTRNLYACDFDLWIRLGLSGKKVYYINKPLATYRRHDQNISFNQSTKMSKQASIIVLSHKKALRKFCLFSYKAFLLIIIARCCKSKDLVCKKRLLRVSLKELFF